MNSNIDYNFYDILKYILNSKIPEKYRHKKQQILKKHHLTDFDGRQSILFFDSITEYEDFIYKFNFKKFVTEIYRNQDEICLLLDPGFSLWIYILL